MRNNIIISIKDGKAAAAYLNAHIKKFEKHFTLEQIAAARKEYESIKDVIGINEAIRRGMLREIMDSEPQENVNLYNKY